MLDGVVTHRLHPKRTKSPPLLAWRLRFARPPVPHWPLRLKACTAVAQQAAAPALLTATGDKQIAHDEQEGTCSGQRWL